VTSPLVSSIRKAIYNGMKGVFLDATLTRDVAGAGDDFDPGTPTQETYACKAIREFYGTGYRPPNLAAGTAAKVTVLQLSLSVTPKVGDRITITGQGGPFAIVGDTPGQPAVTADPANAIWECQAMA